MALHLLYALRTNVVHCSDAKSWPTLCDPMDCGMPGLPVFHYLPEFAQTHGHWAGDPIQPPHPLSSPSPPAFSFSHHQGFFFCFSNESVLCIMWPKDWSFSFSISPSSEYSGMIPLGLTSLISLLFKELSGVFSNITVQKHQFFSAQPSLQSNSPIHIWLLEKKNIVLTIWTFARKVMSLLFNLPFKKTLRAAMGGTWVWPLGWEQLPTPIFWLGEFHGVTKSRTWQSDFHFRTLNDLLL